MLNDMLTENELEFLNIIASRKGNIFWCEYKYGFHIGGIQIYICNICNNDLEGSEYYNHAKMHIKQSNMKAFL